jgi:ABC-type nitrate/sulfonate/bicarbonate transport system permease component
MQDAITTIAVTDAAARAPGQERWRKHANNIFPFVVMGTLWEIVARVGLFPRRLFPTWSASPSAC